MAKRKREDDDPKQSKLSGVRRSPRRRGADNSDSRPRGKDVKSNKAPEAASTPESETNTPQRPHRRSSGGSRSTLIVDEESGDLFDAPPNSVLVHACNCRGYWGAGIAAAFKKRYPGAFKTCDRHCKATTTADLPGTALLIPPQKGDKDQHFVGNLFTSRSIGKSKDPVDVIMQNTGPAMKDLLNQIAEWNKRGREPKVERIWMCKINSGIFGVPWEDTKKVLEEVETPDGDVPDTVTVIFPE